MTFVGASMRTMAVVALCQIAVVAQDLVPLRVPPFSQVGTELRSTITKLFTFLTSQAVDVVEGKELDLRLPTTFAARGGLTVVEEDFVPDLAVFFDDTFSTPRMQSGSSSYGFVEFSLRLFFVTLAANFNAMQISRPAVPFFFDLPIKFLGSLPLTWSAQICVPVYISPVPVEQVKRLCFATPVARLGRAGVVWGAAKLLGANFYQSIGTQIIAGFTGIGETTLRGAFPVKLDRSFCFVALAAGLVDRYDGTSHDALLSTKDRCGERPLGASTPRGFDYYMR